MTTTQALATDPDPLPAGMGGASGAVSGVTPDEPSRRQPTGSNSDAARTMYALLASALGIIPLCSLLRESAWLFDAWFAMLIAIGPAALMRLRWRASTLQIWAGIVLLVPYLTARFVHQHALLGFIPGPGTWHQVHVLLIRLHHTTASGVAPVHTTNAIRLVLCALLPLIAALIDMIAVVGRRGALAGIPLLVIYTVSGAVPRHPVAWPLFIFAAIAFLIVLSLDSRDDAQRWGHFVPRTGVAKRRAAGAISAQRIAAIAVVLAVIIPATVQAKSKNLLADAFHNGSKSGSGANGLGAGTGGIDPFVTLRGDLVRDSPINLLTVQVQRLDSDARTVEPFYARANVLQTYTGTSWVAASHGLLQPLISSNFESSPGTPTAPRTATFRAEITIKSLKSDPPVFLQPDDLGGDLENSTEWSPQDQLLIGGTTHSNQQYNVTFNQPDPTVADLNAANAVDPSLKPWLQLPKIAPMVTNLVKQLTANAHTQYAKALAIDQYFTDPANGFGYNLHVPPGKTGDPLVDFLTNKVGFCQQYAASMGVMLRLAGVPSRVVLGYAHAEPSTNGYFTITTNDAHAWVEAYFEGIGWIPFDPTPLAGISGGTPSDLPWALHGKVSSGPSTTPPVARVTKPNNGLTNSSGPKLGATAAHDAGISAAFPIVGGVIALLLLVAALPWLQRSRRRRRRLSLARSGNADAIWAELSDTATDLGYVWSPARTPRQVVDWLGRDAGTAKPQLAALASAVELARYAPAGEAAADGDALVNDFDRLQAQLTAGREPRQRLRARLLPASLTWTTSTAARLRKIPGLGAALLTRKH